MSIRLKMKKFFLFLLLIMAFAVVRAQVIQVPQSGAGKNEIEKIILQERDFGRDTIALKAYLQPLLESKRELHAVIYNGLLANGYAKYFDGTNTRSQSAHQESILKAKKIKNIPLEIWAQLNYAVYLYDFRDMTTALQVFMEAINNISRISPDKMIFPGASFKKIGYFMGTIGDNAEAIRYLQKALKHSKPDTPEYAAILDNTGQYFFYAGNYKSAAQHFGEAAKMAKKIGDYVRYGKALGNQALIHQKNGDYETAIQLVKEDIAYSEKYQSDQNTMYAYTLLGRLFLESGNVPKAENALNKAEMIAISKSYFQASELEIVKLKLDIFKKLNKTEEELIARRRLSELEDSLLKTDGDLALKKANWQAQKTKYAREIEEANSQYKTEVFKKRIYLALSVIAVLFTAVVIRNTRKKLKKRRNDYDALVLHFEQEKSKFERDLSEAQKNLGAQIYYLKEKNQQIKQLHTEIDRIKNSPSFYIEEEKGRLHELLQSHLMTEDNWVSFKYEFKKEYPEWYKTLLAEFPGLTESNLRVVLLTKLGFANTEISDLLGVSTDAVKKAKQRLKKKLGSRSDILFEVIEQ